MTYKTVLRSTSGLAGDLDGDKRIPIIWTVLRAYIASSEYGSERCKSFTSCSSRGKVRFLIEMLMINFEKIFISKIRDRSYWCYIH